MNSNLHKSIPLFALSAVLGACVVMENKPTTTSPSTPTEAKTEPEKTAESPYPAEQPTRWTAEQKRREVNVCIASATKSLKESGATVPASKIESYCNCVMDKTEARYSYEEANRNADKVIAELQASGVVEACIESAGLKE